MKSLSAFILIILLSMGANGQITITQSDMPHAGEAFITTAAPPDLTIDPEQTGANYTWDFQDLSPSSSTVDSFIDESDLPTVYQLFFFGANLADKTGYAVNFDQFTLDEVYNVYKSTSSSFEQYGYAGTLGGIPIPIVYGDKDVLYHLPLNFGDIDSSESNFVFNLPGFAYISQQRKRVNAVDGWGMVKTPAGSFDALRIKSTISDVDSIYIDSLNYGTNIPLLSYEYKWLSVATGIPVFQINAQDLLGAPVVTQILYQDTTFHTGIHEVSSNPKNPFMVYPVPASEFLKLQFTENMKKPAHIMISNSLGARVYEEEIKQPGSFINVAGWSNGIYILTVTEGESSYHSKFVIHH